MQERLPALMFGGFLLVIAAMMLVNQRKIWLQTRFDAEQKKDVRFLQRRNRRRNQIAGLILIIGLMIPLGDSLIPWKEAPGTFAVYWMIVLTLAIWTGLLAIGDIVSTRMHLSNELNRLHRHELQLKNVVKQIHKNNGSGPGESR